MAGTKAGGMKSKARIIELYGADFYKKMGHAGGIKSKTGGFASTKPGKDGLTGRQRAAVVGAKGGRKSSRKGVPNGGGKHAKTVTSEVAPSPKKIKVEYAD